MIRYFFLTAGIAGLAWGQRSMAKGDLQAGLKYSIAGAVGVFLWWALPLIPFRRGFQWLAGLPARLARIRVEQKVRKEASVGLKSIVAATSGGKGPVSVGEVAAFAPGLFARMGDLSFSRHWLLLPLAVCLAAFQVLLLKEKVLFASLIIPLMGIFTTLYMQNFGRRIEIPNMGLNLSTLLLFLLGMPFQVWGGKVLWAYQHIFFGWFLVTVGSAWMIAVLAYKPFDFFKADDKPSTSWEWSIPRPWFDSERWAVKFCMLMGSILSAYLAMKVFPGKKPGFSVGFGFAAIWLLIGTFPWIPYGLAGTKLPGLVRGFGILVFCGLAMWFGIKGQALVGAGNLGSGLGWFLAGAVSLILGLRHYPGGEADPAPVLEPEKNGSQSSGTETVNTEVTPPKEPFYNSHVWKGLEILFVLGLLIAAFQFRYWNLEWFPWGAEGDEAGGGAWAMEVLNGKYDNPVISSNVPLPYFGITAFFFKIFGVTLTAMRLHAVIFGVLSIATMYFFVRFVFGIWPALLSAVLMSFSYWHLHYSRFGHYNIEQVMMQMVAFWGVFKGMKTGKARYWIMGGCAFGFAMMPHLSSRLLPFLGIIFVIYIALTRRDLLRRCISGFLVFVLASWLVIAPCMMYWLRATHASQGRATSVSIFDKTNTNAPVDTLAGFVRNSKVSIMMFNHFSDSRTRNNPLAPQKILEHWTAILFALAFAYTLYHWRSGPAFFLVAALLINLCASIFAVEAPQTLRTAGNISIVFCIIALPLADIYRGLKDAWKGAGIIVFIIIMVPAIAYFSYASWKKLFVEAKNLAFDVIPTYIAKIAGEEGGPKDQAVFWASSFASSHPPVILFAQDTPIRNFFNLADYLPISAAPGRDHLLFLSDDYIGTQSYVKSLYPDIKFESVENRRGGGPLFIWSKVSDEMIRSIQGMDAQVDFPAGRQTLQNLAPEFPQAGLVNATRVQWKGGLHLDRYGHYSFAATGKGDLSISINGRRMYKRTHGRIDAKETRLGKGLHNISIDFYPAGASDEMKFSWTGKPQASRTFYSLQRTTVEQVKKSDVFDLKPVGLYGEYFATSTWEGEPIMEYIEPGIMAHWLDSPVNSHWSAHWKGRITIEKPGDYRFVFKTWGSYADVTVNGKLVHRSGAPPKPELHPPRIQPNINLAAGTYPIEARFSTRGPSWLELRWQPPGEAEAMLPGEVLIPTMPSRPEREAQ